MNFDAYFDKKLIFCLFHQLKDCELGPIVNRDLNRRIRSVNGISAHKDIVSADIRNAAKIIYNLDSQRKLWETSEESVEKGNSGPTYGFNSKNPLLKNIGDYLIEEANAEEEELLGTSEIEEGTDGEKPSEGKPPIERDESLCKVLDKMLLYLRIVHSIDYYNHIEYPQEDEMPNRIG